MKKLITIIGFTLITSNAYATSEGIQKYCAALAIEACQEAYDYRLCLEYVSADCEDYHMTYSKSVPACIQSCFIQVDQTNVEACLAACKPL